MINPANRKSNSQLTNDITSPHREGKKKSAFPKKREATATVLVELSLSIGYYPTPLDRYYITRFSVCQ